MKQSRILKVELHSYWHVGTGRGTGVGVDAVSFQSHNGLPLWPGKGIKGVFRDAFRQAKRLSVLKPSDSVDEYHLFGQSVKGSISDPSNDLVVRTRKDMRVGGLRFSDARLAVGEEYLEYERWASQAGAELTPYFYNEVANIAIEPNGAVEEGALRMIQLVKPLTLFAEIDYVRGIDDERSPEQFEEAAQTVFQAVERLLPLVRMMGAGRTRGLGQMNIQLLNKAGR